MAQNTVVQWDIHARDAVAQRRFYADVFGWECSHPDNPAEYGWMTTPDGRMLGGIGQAAEGETPGVAIFVQVSDVRAMSDQAVSLGGQLLWGPREFPDGMVTGCVADPAGNAVLLIHPSRTGEPYASRRPAEPDSWQWEIHSPGTVALVPFYDALFGWEVDDPNEWGWAEVRTGSDGGPNGAIATGDAPCTFVYATVGDLPATLELIESLGGRTLVEPWQVSDDLAIAIFTDPEGNRIGLRSLTPSLIETTPA